MNGDQVPDYFNRVNPSLLSLIPAGAENVLEVGCGAGALGEFFRRRSPQCRYFGIEFDADAAKLAASRLTHVVVGDVETIDLARLSQLADRFDCIIFGDVLEHLRDPWAVVRWLSRFLSDQGVILACIPNVQHWSLLSGLLHGQWRYREEGLLDKTHLRFFTRESIEQLFTDAGLVVHDIRSRKSKESLAERKFFESIEPALRQLNIDWPAFVAQAKTVQYVVRAGRSKAVPLLIQARTLQPVAGCNEVRVDQPSRFLSTVPGIQVVQSIMSARILKTEIARKILLLQRPILTRMDIRGLSAMRDAGYLLVVEFDDHPLRWPAIAENEYLTFRGVHAVQTSSAPLADYLRHFNPEITVFRNHLESVNPLPDYSIRDGTILFFGALNREEDWIPIMPAINRVLSQHPDVFVEVIHDRIFFDELLTTNKRFTKTCNYNEYRARLASSDIALLPLLNTEFNRMKSDLKFIEAAAAGVAVLASTVVYSSSVTAGRTGCLYDNEQEFEGLLTDLIKQPESRRSLAREAHEYVRSNRMLSAHYLQRLSWYDQLIERKDALEVALAARMNEYF